MKKSEALKIEKHWNAYLCGLRSDSKTRCIALPWDSRKKSYYCKIVPDENNAGTAFYPVTELSEIANTFKQLCYVSIQDGRAIGMII